MIKNILIQVCAFLFLFPSLSWCADKIKGNACYTYGDNESLIQGDQMAKITMVITSDSPPNLFRLCFLR